MFLEVLVQQVVRVLLVQVEVQVVLVLQDKVALQALVEVLVRRDKVVLQALAEVPVLLEVVVVLEQTEQSVVRVRLGPQVRLEQVLLVVVHRVE